MSNIKTPISKYFLAHLASLVQARTVLNGEVQQERRARPCRGPLDVPINALSPPCWCVGVWLLCDASMHGAFTQPKLKVLPHAYRVLVCWCGGVLVCWWVGVVVCWCVGVLVCYGVGVLVYGGVV